MFKPGDRIELIEMVDDPAPIPPGTRGTVEQVIPMLDLRPQAHQIWVKWDINRSLSLIVPPDVAKVVDGC